ncbi:hypothetical protein B0H16DRAFT_1533642 [Mycena metata]|uniref:Uncharacterized protein n=1 Tax=Mycena metata TaxID=1033252 RepID=A0AAD7J8Y6_9AGAR|nr:hypothetical protein B0H16DRAFT_1533642 [Mycena metata]
MVRGWADSARCLYPILGLPLALFLCFLPPSVTASVSGSGWPAPELKTPISPSAHVGGTTMPTLPHNSTRSRPSPQPHTIQTQFQREVLQILSRESKATPASTSYHYFLPFSARKRVSEPRDLTLSLSSFPDLFPSLPRQHFSLLKARLRASICAPTPLRGGIQSNPEIEYLPYIACLVCKQY